MRISVVGNQQIYNKNVKFEGKNGKLGNRFKGKKGAVIGGLTGLMMCGAMIATYPFDWKKVKTWPIVAMSLTAAGALQGKMIEDAFTKKNKKD